KDTVLQVLVKALPTARVSSTAWSGCVPFEAGLQLHDFYPGKPDACFWQPSAYISSLGNDRYRFSGAGIGTHALSVILERSGCSNTILIPDSVRVFATPEAAFDVLPGTIVDWEYPTMSFRNRTFCTDSVNYSWYFQGTYGWQVKAFSPVVNFPAPGVYDVRLRAVSEHGCSDEAFNQVKVNPPLRFFVPDAFTPDDKLPQENNEFKVSLAESVFDYSLQVFNRWGQKVFVSDRTEEGWNGRTPDGMNCPVGPYAWSLRFRTASGREVVEQGTVLLLR
ncbi:MAG: gliding motility-associated C-terminal domain-containing protein, partial [Bacteroidetes bacterium]|nr:gliding motility-associated C-terminal domain-containing protein [Bacteroidota bacterium]